MTLIKNALIFSLGAISGVYYAQNYDVPNLSKEANKVVNQIKDFGK